MRLFRHVGTLALSLTLLSCGLTSSHDLSGADPGDEQLTIFVDGDDMYFGNDRLPLVRAALGLGAR